MLDAPHRMASATLLCTGARFGDPEQWRERIEMVSASGTPALVATMAGRWFGPGFLEREPERGSALLHALSDADDAGYWRSAVRWPSSTSGTGWGRSLPPCSRSPAPTTPRLRPPWWSRSRGRRRRPPCRPRRRRPSGPDRGAGRGGATDPAARPRRTRAGRHDRRRGARGRARRPARGAGRGPRGPRANRPQPTSPATSSSSSPSTPGAGSGPGPGSTGGPARS